MSASIFLRSLSPILILWWLSLSLASATDDLSISIVRTKLTDSYTIGDLGINGQSLCLTLEKPWKNNATDESCIPPGTYHGTLRHEDTSRWRIELTGTAPRTNVQIHKGNTLADTKGCIVVGMSRPMDDTLAQSSEAMAKLMIAFYGSAEPIATPDKTITIIVQNP